MPDLVPWLQAADPARYYAEGLRIGDSESSERASQSHAQQQLAFEQEQLANTEQQQQAEMQMRQQQLEASSVAAARKYQAQQAYSDFLAQGGDPIQAILKFGPAMGGMSGVAAAVRNIGQPKKTPFVPGPVQSQTVTGPDGTPIPNVYAIPNPTNTGMDVRNVPAPDVAGYVTPQQRADAQAAKTKMGYRRLDLLQKKRALEKLMENELALGATKEERTAKKESIEKQLDAIDYQLDAIESGVPTAEAPAAGNPPQTKGRVLTYDPKSDSLVPSQADEQ